MKNYRGALLCLVSAFCLLAAACTPPTTEGGTPNLAPVPVLVAAPTSGDAPLLVSFSSAGSSDPDGSISSYSWNFGDGTALVTTADATHNYTTAGTFSATLTVKDNGNKTAVATQVITTTPYNVPPVAVLASSATSGVAPLTVDFTGSGSTDSDGAVDTYLWDFGDGTPTTSVADPSHTYISASPHVVTLTVTDNNGASNSDTLVVTVSTNDLPTAVANGTPISGKEPLTVAFSSSGTTDSDGIIAGYSWNFGDNSPVSTQPDPSHTYTSFGNYTATLTVTDDKGGVASNTVSTLVSANQPPHAVANASQTGGIVPVTVLFTASNSTDADGTILSYLWNFGDNNTSSFPNPSHTYGAVGSYTATVTVTDDNGASNTDSVLISVNGVPNVPPTAAATATPNSGKLPLNVTLSSASSTDSDGTIVGYVWDFGDGTGGSSLANPTHAYATAGTFVATLNAVDNNGGVGTATTTVVVNPNQAPTASASGTPTSGKEPLTLAFSSAGSADPDGTLVSRSWDFGDGQSSTAANPSHIYAAHGIYNAVLTVTDDNGAAATANVAIVVNANVAPTATLNATLVSGARPLVVGFDSSGSIDPDGSIASRSLNFGDGSPTTGATITTHTYAVGTWTATLTITDDNGVSATASKVVTVVVDDDNDGVSPPTDCNDTVATTYPGAADSLDAAGTDSNCDGIDGSLPDTVLVSAGTGSNTAGCGLAVASPCQTIPYALGIAGSGRHAILVASGASYGGFSLSSANNLTIRGGYASSFASRSGTTTATSGVSIISSTGVTLRDLTLVGPGGLNTTAVLITSSTVTLNGITATSGTASGVGSSAYGVRAITSSNVTVQNSVISASAGISGSAGTTPSAGLTAGVNGASGATGVRDNNSANAAQGATGGGTGINNGGNGGNGNGDAGAAGANGGAAGSGGCNNCRSNSNYSGGGGGGGRAGGSGAAGANGTASTPVFGATFTPTTAGNGTTGANGGGGGGGGGGGRTCGATFCAGTNSSGGSGGKGGGGGQGGGGGTAGIAAGGSFAVHSFNSTVAIDANSTLATANGGVGGAGGNGQGGAGGGQGGAGGIGVKADNVTGGPGAAGGSGATNSNGGDGGDGSAGTCCNGASGGGAGGGGGGNGGNGGNGGGGAGGPSVAMLSKGTGGITFGGNLTSQVTIGSGGAGGTSSGNAGTAGTAAKTFTVA